MTRRRIPCVSSREGNSIHYFDDKFGRLHVETDDLPPLLLAHVEVAQEPPATCMYT